MGKIVVREIWGESRCWLEMVGDGVNNSLKHSVMPMVETRADHSSVELIMWDAEDPSKKFDRPRRNWDELVTNVELGIHQFPRGCFEGQTVAFGDLGFHP